MAKRRKSPAERNRQIHTSARRIWGVTVAGVDDPTGLPDAVYQQMAEDLMAVENCQKVTAYGHIYKILRQERGRRLRETR